MEITMTATTQASNDALIFRGTNKHKGRRVSVAPDNSRMKHLAYGRVILDQEVSEVSFSTGGRETGFICMAGQCAVRAEGVEHQLAQYDSIYIPRDTNVEIRTDSSVDLVECSADVENRYPVQVV